MKKNIINFVLNDERISTEINPAEVLLDFLRKTRRLTGAKEVCKEGDCGACAVLIGELINDEIEYSTVTSCIYPMGNVDGKHVVTIEGLNRHELSAVQREFAEEEAAQCGFCTPGYIISTTGYLLKSEKIDLDSAINSIAGNICRCTGYGSIKRAIEKISKSFDSIPDKPSERINYLIDRNVLPEYFAEITGRLDEMGNENMSSAADAAPQTIVGGGTDLFIQKPEMILQEDPYFINSLDLRFIEEDNEKIEIGAAASFEDVKNSRIIQNLIPEIRGFMDLIASLPIRNSATIAGNLVNASPIGDMTVMLLALDAKLIIRSGEIRVIDLARFYLGYKEMDKLPEDIIEAVRIYKSQNELHFNFEKVSKRTHLDIASVNSAAAIEIENDMIKKASISAGGVAPIPLLLEKASAFLAGKKITPIVIKQLLAAAQEEIAPIDDIRGSAEYKRILLNQLIKAHFIKLFPGKIKMGELL